MEQDEGALGGTRISTDTGSSYTAVGVITRVERRRRWTDDQKLSILSEADAPGSSASEVCRRHGISSGLFYKWRSWRQQLDSDGQPNTDLPSFAEVQVAPERLPSLPATGVIEIELPGGSRVRVDSSVDITALRRVLAALSR